MSTAKNIRNIGNSYEFVEEKSPIKLHNTDTNTHVCNSNFESINVCR